MFTSWANVLRATPHAQLMLLNASGAVRGRVIAEAAARGVHPSRLVFASSRKRDPHIQRYSEGVDLVLDPRLITGHTTTADGLWAGVPTLTLQVGSLAGKVSASFLAASGAAVTSSSPDYAMPSLLISHSLLSYESTAAALTAAAMRVIIMSAKGSDWKQSQRQHALQGRGLTTPAQYPAAAVAITRLWSLRRRVLRSSLSCAMLNWYASIQDLERGYRAVWEARAVSEAPTTTSGNASSSSSAAATAAFPIASSSNTRRALLSAPVPSWRQGGYHVAVDPDARAITCVDPRVLRTMMMASPPANQQGGTNAAAATEDRLLRAYAVRLRYERQSAAALEAVGFDAAAAACKERLGLL